MAADEDSGETGLRAQVSLTLYAGVWLGGGLMAAGLACDVLAPEPSPLLAPTLAAAVSAALAGSGEGLIMLGVLAMSAAPVARVGLLAAGYARRREWPYALASATVFLLLLLGMALGGRHAG